MIHMERILGYGDYSADIEGNIWSHKHGGLHKMKPRCDRDGYLLINLCFNGIKETFKVHRLVYLTFKGPLDHNLEIDHINGIPSDNRVDNLAQVDSRTNTQRSRGRMNTASAKMGVVWDKQQYIYIANILYKKRHICLMRGTERGCARAYEEACKMIQEGTFEAFLEQRDLARIESKTSKYTGVVRYKSTYRASIQFKKSKYYLCCGSEEYCAKVYQEAKNAREAGNFKQWMAEFKAGKKCQ